jgi:hypothetical protein
LEYTYPFVFCKQGYNNTICWQGLIRWNHRGSLTSLSLIARRGEFVVESRKSTMSFISNREYRYMASGTNRHAGYIRMRPEPERSRAETRTPTYWVLCGRHHRFAFASGRFNYALPAIHGFLSALVSYPPDVAGNLSVSAFLRTAQ